MISEKISNLLGNPVYKKVRSFIHKNFFEILFLICCIIFYYGCTISIIDEYYYLAQLISIFEDGDLDIYNNFSYFTLPHKNYWSIGPALFWAPFYLIGRFFFFLITTIFPFMTEIYSVYLFDVCLANLGTMFYTYLGLKFLGKAVKKYYPKRISPLYVQIPILFCTQLIYFVYRWPLMAHAISFFTISSLIYLWVNWHEKLSIKQMWWIFFILGLASTVRWHNILFGIIFLPQIQKTFKFHRSEKSSQDFIKFILLSILIISLGGIIGVLPQLIAWGMQFQTIIPPHSVASFKIFSPNFFEVWFGVHGLFIWHPITLIFLIGLVITLFNKTFNKLDNLVLLLAFLLQSYIWAIFEPPMPNWSFGMRGLINSLPLLIFGFINIIVLGYKKNIRNTNIAMLIVLIFFSLMNLYLFALLGEPYGDVALTSDEVPLNLAWFFNIDWELLYNTFIPKFTLDKVLVLVSLGLFIFLFNVILKTLVTNTSFILSKKAIILPTN